MSEAGRPPPQLLRPDVARDRVDWICFGGRIPVVNNLGLLQGKPKK